MSLETLILTFGAACLAGLVGAALVFGGLARRTSLLIVLGLWLALVVLTIWLWAQVVATPGYGSIGWLVYALGASAAALAGAILLVVLQRRRARDE